MNYEILDLTESERGCGFRKKGGVYLTLLSGKGMGCGRLPVPFTKCPCCGEGISKTPWPRMVLAKLILQHECKRVPKCNKFCPLSRMTEEEPMLLLWVGEQYYRTPEQFIREAERMGVSRRITQVPKGFELGKTWVVLAHANAITEVTEDGEVIKTPGAFYLYKPDELQYVVQGDESEEELQRLFDRGYTLVRITENRNENLSLDFGQDEEPEICEN